MAVVTRLLEQLAKEMRRTAETADVDAVHDLRVSVRRATEALRLFCPGEKRLRKELKAIRERAAAVRDRDVTRLLLRRHRLPVSDPAMIYLTAQRDLAAEELQKFLRRQIQKGRPRR